MKELATEYMGLKLPTPLIVSSSPLTASAPQIAELAAHGAGAVVLKSTTTPKQPTTSAPTYTRTTSTATPR